MTDETEANDADRIEAILEINETEGDNTGSEVANYMVRAAQASTKEELARIIREAQPFADCSACEGMGCDECDGAGL